MTSVSRTAAQVAAGIVIGIFVVGIWINGDPVHPAWFRSYSVAVTALLGCIWLWDRVLWRTSIAQKRDGVPRDLAGTWSGTLTSFWKDPQTGQCPPSKSVYLAVRQSASHASVTLISDESESTSSMFEIISHDGHATLAYMYLNKPDSRHEHRSRIHHGSTMLTITGTPATRLRGRYWTDRDTRGELDFVSRVPSVAEDFDEAVALFSKQSLAASRSTDDST